jgi:hypothetical protein
MIDVMLLVLEILRGDGLPAYTELPEGVGRPVIRVEESGGDLPNSRQPAYLIRQDVQIDAWGTSKAEARSIIGAAYEALHAAASDPVSYDNGSLSYVQTLGGFLYLPDEDWPVDGRPGPRFELTVRLTAHE